MSDKTENHIFTARLLVIAFITAVITSMVMVGAYESIEFVQHARDLVNISYTK